MRSTFRFKELVSVLCLVMMAWTLVAPSVAPDILLILPVVGIFSAVFVAHRVSFASTSHLRILDPSISFISLRAPPLQ
jgi:hypothetical protein